LTEASQKQRFCAPFGGRRCYLLARNGDTKVHDESGNQLDGGSFFNF
jgi:hypothetical protein